MQSTYSRPKGIIFRECVCNFDGKINSSNDFLLRYDDQINTKIEPCQELSTAQSPVPHVQSDGPTDLTQIHGETHSKLFERSHPVVY